MKIKVQTLEKNWTIELDNNPANDIETLKSKITDQTGIPSDSQRLIYQGRQANQLSDIKEGSTLVLLSGRKPPPQKKEEPSLTKRDIVLGTGGTEQDVEEILKNPPKNTEPHRESQNPFLRMLLGLPPRPVPPPQQQPQPQTQQQPSTLQFNQNDIDDITNLGFSSNAAKKALAIARMDKDLAIEWIIEHSEDSDLNDELTSEQLSRLAGRSSTSSIPTPSAAPPPFFMPPSMAPPPQQNSRENEEAVQRLLEMGFKEDDVRNALRVCGGDEEAACSYLLGERPSVGPVDSLVRGAMSNPRLLNAFMQIMQNPSSAPQLLQDPEIGPILQQLLQRDE